MPLLSVTSSKALGLYLLADHGIFIIYEVIRRDFIFFFPMLKSASYPGSLIFGVVNETIADFTGCLHFRLPAHLGGAYFFFNLVASQTSVLVAVHIYNTSFEDNGDGTK